MLKHNRTVAHGRFVAQRISNQRRYSPDVPKVMFSEVIKDSRGRGNQPDVTRTTIVGPSAGGLLLFKSMSGPC